MAKATSRQKARDLHKQRAARTARKQRKIQRVQDKRNVQSGNRAAARKRVVRAGERREATSFPEQHLAKPGRQHRLDPVPNDGAPYQARCEKLEDPTEGRRQETFQTNVISRGVLEVLGGRTR